MHVGIKIIARWTLFSVCLAFVFPYTSDAGEKSSIFSVTVSILMIFVVIDMLLISCRINRCPKYLLFEMILYALVATLFITRLLEAAVFESLNVDELSQFGEDRLAMMFILLLAFILGSLLVMFWDAWKLYLVRQKLSRSKENGYK